MNFLYFVYSYSMREYEELEIWTQRIARSIISYHDDAHHAHMCVINMINNDLGGVGWDECWGIGAIPLSHDEHNLV